MKVVCEIMDARFSGFAFRPHPPVVAPVYCRPRWWRFWQKGFPAWAVVQPKREVFGGGVDWVWRHVAVFRREQDARDFLAKLETAE